VLRTLRVRPPFGGTLPPPPFGSEYHPQLWLFGSLPLPASFVTSCYASTSTPMDRAVPAIIFIAASTSLALRSGIFVSAI